MRISFDIDGLLVAREFSRERLRWPFLRGTAEGLRLGAKDLFDALRQQGHSLSIYTTSLRSTARIRWWLWLHGITIDEVINGQRHAKLVMQNSFTRAPSKYPPGFGIQLHIDDSPGVLEEGKAHGYGVLVIAPNDQDWTHRVLEGVRLHQALRE